MDRQAVTRRAAVSVLGGSVFARPMRARAQAATYRIGLLGQNSRGGNFGLFDAPLIRALAARGYVSGKNLTIERRGAGGDMSRLPALVQEIVDSHVTLILAGGYWSAVAAKQGTMLPVVVNNAGDPVRTGLVTSLARPGGHLTGISDISAEVTPKRMELLKQFSPGVRRVPVLYNADDPAMTLRYVAARETAQALGVEIQPLGVREPADFDEAIRGMTDQMPDGILMVSDALTELRRQTVFDFAKAHRLPAIYEFDYLTRDGGLMSYGVDLDEVAGRMSALVDRILKGTKAEDLPFEQPTRFRFALNLKTAKAIGFDTPASLLAFADEVEE
jgi:putative ABC transport system substrate-binding protein